MQDRLARWFTRTDHLGGECDDEEDVERGMRLRSYETADGRPEHVGGGYDSEGSEVSQFYGDPEKHHQALDLLLHDWRATSPGDQPTSRHPHVPAEEDPKFQLISEMFSACR
ncbi:unnamed protein product [Chrysoparadoxa australica]